MPKMFCSLAAAVLLLVPASTARAQVDPSGHWSGVIKTPSAEVPFEIDVARGAADGTYAGTLSMPAQQLKGLPLRRVSVEGRTIQFSARSDQQFAGTVSGDGASIEGELKVAEGSAPVTLNRQGDAHIEPPLSSPRLSAELAGAWTATLSAGDASMHLVLTAANQSNDSAVAYLENHDEGDLRMPVRLTQRGTAVTIDSPIFNGSFAGTLTADATEIAGTYRQGAFSAPLTFRRAR